MDRGYPNGWTPRHAAYDVTETRVRGGTVRVHTPRRTEAEEAAFRDGVDSAIQAACPGWRLKRDNEAEAVV